MRVTHMGIDMSVYLNKYYNLWVRRFVDLFPSGIFLAQLFSLLRLLRHPPYAFYPLLVIGFSIW